MLLLIRF